MKRSFLFFLILIFGACLMPSFVFATPLEGTIFPRERKWKVGSQVNFVERQDIDYLAGEAETHDYFVSLQYGLFEFLSLDFKLGVGDVDYNRDGMEVLDFDDGFAGAYGLRVKLYEEGHQGVKFVVGFHHISVHPPSERDSGNLKQELIWDDWQFDGMMFQEFGRFRPYVGAKVKRVYLIRKIDGDRVRMKSDDEIGLAAGLDVELRENVHLNLEARFLDEEAYSFGVSYQF